MATIPSITPNAQPFPTLGQTQVAFDSSANYLWATYFPNYETEINTTIGVMNSEITVVNNTAIQVASDAQSASDSASNASSSANNVGAWSLQTGTATPPYSVTHNGNTWILNLAIADITLSEPTAVNTDWTKAGGITKVEANTNPEFVGLLKEQVSVSTLTLGATSSVQTYTATADFTIVDDLESGEFVTFILDSAGFTPSYPTIIWWEGAAPTLGTKDKIFFENIGGLLYGSHVASIA